MTYKESYMKCKTLVELKNEIASDITIAMLMNPDRIQIIKVIGEEVVNLKFNEKES